MGGSQSAPVGDVKDVDAVENTSDNVKVSDVKVNDGEADGQEDNGKAENSKADDFNVLDLLRHLQEQEGYEVYDIFERGRERVPTQVRLWLEDKEDWLATSDSSKAAGYPAAQKEANESGDINGENGKEGVAESEHWVLLSMPKPAAAPKGRGRPPGAKGKGPPPPPKGGPKAKSKPPPPPPSKDSKQQPPGRRQSIGKAQAPPPPPFGKRLHWKLLPPAILGDTIFEELQPWDNVAPPLDTKQLERLFTPGEKSLGVPISAGPAPLGKAGRVCLIDPKRAQNLAIILRQVTLPTEELCEVLKGLRLEHSISTEALEHIHENLLPPLLESAELFASYDGPPESLRDVERQLLPLARIPRLKARMQCLHFGKNMPHLQSSLKARIRTLREACEQVRNSGALRRVLGTVLRLGNFLNHGVDAPDAYGVEVRGFTMESLLKLRDFRAGLGAESSVTALHCIALHLLPGDAQLPSKLREELRAALEVGGDAASCAVTASSGITELREAVGRFRREAELTRNEAEHFSASYESAGGSSGPPPLETLRRLAKDSNEMADTLEAELEDAITKALRLLEYFGERREKGGGSNSASKEDELVERFFVTLKDFTASLEVCWKEVVEQPRKLRLEAVVGVVTAREEQRVASPKTDKDEKPSEDAGDVLKCVKKPGLGLLAGEAVAAVRRRSRVTAPARPASFVLGGADAGRSSAWLSGAGMADVD